MDLQNNCYAPDKIKHRKNVNLTKISDSTVIALLLWQSYSDIVSQRSFCSISRSRFNRRCRMLAQLCNLIRRKITSMVNLSGHIMIIDGLLISLCRPVRNKRTKLFKGFADIGYKASKKEYIYGFKAHFIAGDDGYILNYCITPASVNDAKVAEELIMNTAPAGKIILGDRGYLGKAFRKI